MLAARREDPEFRAEYERARREIDQVDSVIRQLDQLREEVGLTKAALARHIGRGPSSIRRLFTAKANPELLLVASIAEDLGSEIRIVPRKPKPVSRRRTATAKRSPNGSVDSEPMAWDVSAQRRRRASAS